MDMRQLETLQRLRDEAFKKQEEKQTFKRILRANAAQLRISEFLLDLLLEEHPELRSEIRWSITVNKVYATEADLLAEALSTYAACQKLGVDCKELS